MTVTEADVTKPVQKPVHGVAPLGDEAPTGEEQTAPQAASQTAPNAAPKAAISNDELKQQIDKILMEKEKLEAQEAEKEELKKKEEEDKENAKLLTQLEEAKLELAKAKNEKLEQERLRLEKETERMAKEIANNKLTYGANSRPLENKPMEKKELTPMQESIEETKNIEDARTRITEQNNRMFNKMVNYFVDMFKRKNRI